MSSATPWQISRKRPCSSPGSASDEKVRSLDSDLRPTSPITSPSSSATSPLERPRQARSRKSIFLGVPAKARRTPTAAARNSPQVTTPSITLSWRSRTLPTKGTLLMGRSRTYSSTASRVDSTRLCPSGLLSSEQTFASIGFGPMPAEHVNPPVRSLIRCLISATTAPAALGPPCCAMYDVRSRYASSRDQAWKLGSYSRKISRASLAARVYLPKSGAIKTSSSGGILEPTSCGCRTISAAMNPGIAERTPYSRAT
mmetsp:Transcript_90630/g.255906  ORF Transcript_90630/g.255906 Transcript_90630/m.255906 type:complete len:256 (+) Transcript_90630:822-1589(+)